MIRPDKWCVETNPMREGAWPWVDLLTESPPCVQFAKTAAVAKTTSLFASVAAASRHGWPAGVLPSSARRHLPFGRNAFARLPIGGEGAFEGGACECFACHAGDHAETAVGRLGVAEALATPCEAPSENLLLQAILENRGLSSPMSPRVPPAYRELITIGVDVARARMTADVDWESMWLERKREAAAERAWRDKFLNAQLGVPFERLGQKGVSK